jgi:hypothetical protein
MMLRSGKPFVWESVENDKESVKGERPLRFFEACQEGLRALEADLVIPFTSEQRLLGFLTAKTTERSLSFTSIAREYWASKRSRRIERRLAT